MNPHKREGCFNQKPGKPDLKKSGFFYFCPVWLSYKPALPFYGALLNFYTLEREKPVETPTEDETGTPGNEKHALAVVQRLFRGETAVKGYGNETGLSSLQADF